MVSTVRIRVLVAMVAILLVHASSTEGGILSDIRDGFKTVVAAPFKAGGWLVGQGVQSALDPAMDGASRRMRETIDYAALRLEATLDKELVAVDQIAQRNIQRLDSVLEHRLGDVDAIMDARIRQAGSVAAGLLDRQAAILDNAQTRAEFMLDKNMMQLDRISSESLDRLDHLQADAFAIVSSALQDQVPFAASRVAYQIVVATTIIVFIVVLVGFTGVRLLKKSTGSARQANTWANIKSAGADAARIGPAMMFLALVILGSYGWYRDDSNSRRVDDLERAAKIFEENSDYRSATRFRKRVFALCPSRDKLFTLERDRFLGSVSQTHGPDYRALRVALTDMQDGFPDDYRKDGDLRAAAIYLGKRALSFSGRVESVAAETVDGERPLPDQISDYREDFLSGDAAAPSLGYLVLVTEIRMLLSTDAGPAESARDAVERASELVERYPQYAFGYIIRGQLRAIQLERQGFSPSGVEPDPRMKVLIWNDIQDAELREPLLAKRLELFTTDVPEPAIVAFLNYQSQYLEEGAHDLESERGRKFKQEANAFALTLRHVADDIYGWGALAELETERAFARAIKRGVGESRLKEAVAAARGDSSRDKSDLCLRVAELAIQLARPDIALDWIHEADDSKQSSQSPDRLKKKISIMESRAKQIPLQVALLLR